MVTFEPNMGTPSHIADRISCALFTKTQRAVLGLLLTPDRPEFHLREIVRRSGVGQGAVQRELSHMTKAEILNSRSEGRQVYYRANLENPVFQELVQLTGKLMGVEQLLRVSLLPLRDKINVALVYGSFARGEARAGSDVDVLIVGQVTHRELAPVLKKVQQQTGREINPTIYPVAEYSKKVQAGHHFLASLQSDSLIFLIGDADELAGLG